MQEEDTDAYEGMSLHEISFKKTHKDLKHMSAIIYNVTCNMKPSIEERWLEWVKECIPRVLGTGLFMDARLTRVLVEDEDSSSTFSVQYKAIDRNALNIYLSEYAEKFRKEGFEEFGDNVLSFRTELEMIDEYRVNLK